MAEGTEVGVAYVRLVPSMRGFSGEVERKMRGSMPGLGQKAGEQVGDSLASGVGSGVDKGKGKLSTAAGKIGDVFKAGLAVAGVAAGALLIAGVTSSLETEAVEDRLAAQLGGGAWAESMGETAGDLYLGGFGDSVADTASAVRATVQAGLVPPEATNAQVDAMTEKVLTFADVMEQDLGKAAEAAGTMVKNGLAKDGAEALDILTRGSQLGADKAQDLLDTMTEYPTVLRDVGLNGAEAMGLLTQGLQAGARDSDTVADALKEFAIRGQDASEASAAGFEAIGLNAEEMTAKVAQGGPAAREALDAVLDGLRNMEDPVARNAAAVALFGTKAEDMGDALFSLDLDTAASELGTVAGATDELGSAYDNNAAKIETFRRQALDKLASFLGGTVIPKLEQFGRWAQENPTAIKIAAGVIGGVLVAAFAAWAVSATMAAAATLAATWPILLIGAAVIGLAALVITHWDTISSATTTAFGVVKGAISGAFNWVKRNWPLLLAILTGPIGLATLAIVRHWGTIKSGFTAVKTWIGNRVSDIVGFFTGLPGRLSRAAGDLWGWIKTKFKTAINGLIGLWNGLHFPSVTVGGGDPLGPFGPSLPSVTIGGWDLPNIPYLASGGILEATPGGVPFVGAEGGEDEVVAPLSRLQPMLDDAILRALEGSPAAGPAAPAQFVLDASGADRRFVEWLRNLIRAKGGDVQLVLGPASR